METRMGLGVNLPERCNDNESTDSVRQQRDGHFDRDLSLPYPRQNLPRQNGFNIILRIFSP